MGAYSAGAAKPEGQAAGAVEQPRPREVRDIRPDGRPGDKRLGDGPFGAHPGRRSALQVDAVELALDAPDLDPELRRALDYWQHKRGARLAPSRADIDPIDLAPLLPRVMLVDVSTDPLDFRFRLAGTGIFKIHGAELTNKRALELEPPAYAALTHRLYSDAVERRAPLAHRLLIEVETRRSAYTRIILPLSDSGSEINRLMTVESYADCAQDLRDCFEEARLGG